MRAGSTVTAIGLALWLTAPSAHALGFGRVINATQLGQSLNLAAMVRLEGDETLARECVSAEVMVGDNRLQPNQLRVTLEAAADPSERSVRITSSALIDEPVMTVSITVGCNVRMTRKFTLFVDPPLVNLAQADTPALPPQRVESQIAPLTDIVQGTNATPAAQSGEATGRALTRPPRTGTAAVVTPGRTADARPRADKPAAERPTRPSTRLAAAPRAPSGPRLRLEAAPPMPSRSASAASPTSPGAGGTGTDPLTVAALAAAASAASAADAASQQLALERQRLKTMEDSLAQLRSESQATQKALAALQTKLSQTESERYANPLVYGLAWLSALLAVAVAALWWRQSRQGGPSQWWSANPPAAEAESSRRRASLLRDPISSPQGLATGPDVAGAYEPINSAVTVQTLPPPTPPAPAPVMAPAVAQPEPTRELSVEELIDLEQQAEFFIVLGQDDAAIELLMSHVRSDGGISPLPYLKLLEIYRRRGEVDAYQRIRERFNRRFNAYAPDWQADLQQGRSLEDYPAVVDDLQRLWPDPDRTMDSLDGMLFRRKPDDQTFDLPAYRELLFLYSIARDLAELNASRPGADVDLLLPIGDVDDEGPISQLMTATSAFDMRQGPASTLPLDLEFSLTPPGAPSASPSPAPDYGISSGFIDLSELDPPDRKGTTGKR